MTYPIISDIIYTSESGKDSDYFTICDPDRYTIRQFFVNILCMRDVNSYPLRDFTIVYSEFLDTLYVYSDNFNTLWAIRDEILDELHRG